FATDPRDFAPPLLGKATTRVVYDLDRFRRCGQPPFAATIERETHFHATSDAPTRLHIGFAYSDGFARVIQTKVQAEPGSAPARSPTLLLGSGDPLPGNLVRTAEDVLVDTPTLNRWVGSGRTVFNNKSSPV